MPNRFYSAGAWCWIATGTVHDALDVIMRISPPESEAPLNATLRALPFDLLGMGRSYYEVTMGISLGMGLAMVFTGVLFLFVARTVTDTRHAHQAAMIGLGASLAMLAIAVSFEPLPPIVTFGLASLCFAAALRGAGRAPIEEYDRLHAAAHPRRPTE